LTLYKSNFPDGFSSNNTPAVISIVAIVVEQFTLTGTNITNGYITVAVIPEQAVTVQVDWNGICQYSPVDYTVSGANIVFNNSLLALMVAGDLVKVSYQ